MTKSIVKEIIILTDLEGAEAVARALAKISISYALARTAKANMREYVFHIFARSRKELKKIKSALRA